MNTLRKFRLWFRSKRELVNQVESLQFVKDDLKNHLERLRIFNEVFELLEDRDPCFWRDDEELTPVERCCTSIRRVFAEKQALERQLGCDCKDKI